MATHRLKTWPVFFEAVLTDRKTFEYRFNDKDFRVGDELILEEWQPGNKIYTGRAVAVKVTYIMPSMPSSVIPMVEGYVIMGTKRCS